MASILERHGAWEGWLTETIMDRNATYLVLSDGLSSDKHDSFFQQYSPGPHIYHIPFQVLWDTAASFGADTP